jgi:hypothetical protein
MTEDQLAAAYQRVDGMWEKSGLWRRAVHQTPNWQDGYCLLINWYREKAGLPPWEGGYPYVHSDNTWQHEVHVFSHTAYRPGGHSVEHAMLEEEGARVVLDWWNKKQQL